MAFCGDFTPVTGCNSRSASERGILGQSSPLSRRESKKSLSSHRQFRNASALRQPVVRPRSEARNNGPAVSARQAANNQTLPVAHRPDTPFGGLEGLPLHGKQAAQDLAECLSLFRCFTPACCVAIRSSAARRRLLAIT